jgi:hypothetical protein
MYLFGQDEGTYFGCELPPYAVRPTTVADAFQLLTPVKARNKVGVQRQGEWFSVPTIEEKVPSLDKCLASNNCCLNLPVAHPDSHLHEIQSVDIRLAKDGVIYALDPVVKHNAGEHEDLVAQGWVMFACNTAVQSFSVEGVD